MEWFNSALGRNITFVRPPYFKIGGFGEVPNIGYYFAFLFCIYILSFVGNTVVMTIILLDYRLRSPKYIVVFNLAFVDLLSSSTMVPKTLDIFLFNHRTISYSDCLAFMFFCFIFISMQSFNLVVLSYDRLIAILYPLHYHVKVTHKRILYLIAFFWIFSVTTTFCAVTLLTRISFCKSVVIKSYFCDHGPMVRLACNDITPSMVMSGSLPILKLGCPLVFIVATYCCIGYALSKISTFQERMKAFKTCTGHLSLVAIYFFPILVVQITF
ncbi:olfactory receptor 1F1-like [Amphiprion ocellaris]|uniref:olfactory receptor 1F1-like n=1 Tax=Amphiprion ocellaris TaxID=80972 RepID=UPI00241149CE|nr:olfactory receptor 1F1-like [Amphiprion ocellaris]